ncbi:MAG: acyl--CoA ligase [Gammaproteobacteria bacterium]|nr:acyl--CoA ligase [Gammaproteobacteria bacterium]
MRAPASLPELLLGSTEKGPDTLAIVDGDRRIRYAELWAQIRSVAGFVKELGIRPGDRVALLLENSIEYVVAYYAVQLGGGVCVALNTASKARDIVNWIRHSDARLLFADRQHPEFAAVRAAVDATLPAIVVGEAAETQPGVHAWAEALACAAHDVDPGGIADNTLASIIYTSGTTGNPKGVCLSHRNLFSNIRSILDYLALSAADSIVNVLPFFYSYGNSILHTHLAAGARIVLEKSMLYPVQVFKRIAEERASGFSGVPSTYSILLNRVDIHQFDLSSLRYMTQAGGPMAPADIQRLTSALPDVRFFVMYGQTEASARLSYLPPERLFDKLGSIGVAIPGVRIEVRDPQGGLLLPHQPGELCAQGENIMQGYWKDPHMTQGVLRDGWLHTGDLAYRDEDGYLFIVGRASDMIKSGAHRISPKDIEEVALEVDGIAEAVAVGMPDELLGQVIKLIVVKRPGAELDAMTIQRHCKQNLASYKIPKIIEFAESIPRTSSGKVQRFKLQQG